jgi:hypothetical protein
MNAADKTNIPMAISSIVTAIVKILTQIGKS